MKKIFLPLAVIATFTILSCGGNKTEQNTLEKVENKEDICFYSYDQSAGTQVRWTCF